MRLRQSTLKIWNMCALQAHLDATVVQPKQVGSKAVFGTCVHHCLEAYHRGTPIDRCVELFKQVWDDPSSITDPPTHWNKGSTYGGLRLKGVEILREYHQKNQWENKQVLASEHRFLVPFGEHELQGTVDHLEIRKAGNGKRTLRVVDYKTNSKRPTFMELRLNLQFTTYIYATLQQEFWVGNGPEYPGMTNGEELWEKTKKMARRGVWYHLMTNQEIDAGERDDGDFMRLYRLVEQIQRANDAQVFVPTIGEACTFCAHTAHCGIEIPERDRLALEEV